MSPEPPPSNQLFHCDCVEGMARLPRACIPLTITSPPYDDKFHYGGHKWSFDVFSDVANQLWRITTPGGVVCWVIEDQSVEGSLTCTKHRQVAYFKRLGFDLFDEIYIWRTAITHQKHRHPEQITNCFVLSKGRPRHVNRIADRPNVTAGEPIDLYRRRANGDRISWKSNGGIVPTNGFRTNLWKVVTGKHSTTKDDVFDFPSLMPESLARDLITTFSTYDDLVLDPFCGAGTTPKMAMLAHRSYLGFEIWDKAYALSLRRIERARIEYQRRLDRIVIGQRSEAERVKG